MGQGFRILLISLKYKVPANLIIKTHHGPIVKTDGSRTPADTGTDVAVRINGTPVAVAFVRGLIGEVEINFALWTPGDTIDVSYTWAPDPVYMMVLPDPDDPSTWAFRLNEWHTYVKIIRMGIKTVGI